MKIYGYGDSYLASDNYRGPSWAQILASRVSADLDNKSVNGGSAEHAIKMFVNDIKENKFKDGDLIIFVRSTVGRFALQYQIEHPGSSAAFNDPLVINPNHATYYNLNKHHINWYKENLDYDLLDINHLAYKYLIKDFALNNPNIKIILLELLEDKIFPTIGKVPKNLYIPNIKLVDISKNEIKNVGILKDYWYHAWVKYSVVDARVNHLTLPNLYKMVDLSYDFYVNNIRTENFQDYFLTDCIDILKDQSDFKNYVSKGLLYDYNFKYFK